MTDRINGLTVVLDEDFRDDSEYLLRLKSAILCLKGVIAVDACVMNPQEHIGRTRAEVAIAERVTKALFHPAQETDK